MTLDQLFTTQGIITIFGFLATMISLLAFISAALFFAGYFAFLFYKYRNREKTSLDSVLLQVALPRDNEIKIDAAEQMFAGFASIRKSGRFAFLKPQPHISFEIVGMPGDIRFYVHTPNKLRDLVEKQINGTYPDAEIKVVDENDPKQKNIIGNEYNFFTENGKVAFAPQMLKGISYMPIRVFKDLPVDGLSLLTSVLAKMTEGEGAAVQIIISPADPKWKKLGRKFISRTKKAESNPETAKYSTDPKELEGIENKIGKPGFNVTIREIGRAHV